MNCWLLNDSEQARPLFVASRYMFDTNLLISMIKMTIVPARKEYEPTPAQ